MALYYELSVYWDTYKLILKVFECTKGFPKECKYSLSQNLKLDALHDCYLNGTVANSSIGHKSCGADADFTSRGQRSVFEPPMPTRLVFRHSDFFPAGVHKDSPNDESYSDQPL